MLQFLVAVIIIIGGKLIWDIINQQKNVHKAHKRKGRQNGEVIDLSNAWVDLNDMPYRRRDYLLTGRELAAYHTISDVLEGTNYTVFPKVRLAEILTLATGADNRSEYMNRIRERYVDFLVCEGDELKPVLVIICESPAEGKKKQLVDRFTRHATEAAGLAYISLDVSNFSSKEDFIRRLQKAGLSIMGKV